MKVEPKLKDWAEAIYAGTVFGRSKEATLKWLEAELNDIADKYYQLGFEDGDKDGWWKSQEEEIEAKLMENSNAIQQVIKNLKKEFPNGFHTFTPDED